MRDVYEIAVLIRTAARLQAGGLGEWLLSVCWPGGVEDSGRQITPEWLARFHLRPDLDVQFGPGCGCAEGHCLVCN
jgi:hypothetical protein